MSVPEGFNLSGFLFFNGDTLVTYSNQNNDRIVSCYRIKENTLIPAGGGIRSGRGPGEVLYPNLYSDKSGVFVVNGSLGFGDLLLFSQDASGTLSLRNKWDISWLKPFFCHKFVILTDGRILFLGGPSGEKALLTIVDPETKETSILDFWPDDAFNGDNLAKQIAYCGNASIAVNGEKVMYACMYGKYLDIMTMKGNTIISHNPVYDKLPELESSARSGFGAIDKSGENGVTANATQQHIYVRHGTSQETVRDDGFPWFFADEIEVLDWEGNYVSKLVTNEPFGGFIISEDDKYLLTWTMGSPDSDELCLMVYNLWN